MLKGISTQEEVTAFKYALELMAANLSYHVNEPLSKAHGISLCHGFIDGSGNDRRTYQDSHGVLISGSSPTAANFVRFIVDGTAYYAPNLHSDPGPQAATTGAIQTTPVAVPGPTDTALITDYVTYEVNSATNLNNYVLQHTELPHEIAHTPSAPLKVVANPVYAASGALIANYRLQIPFHDRLYEIPVDPRIGGPLQLSATCGPMSLIANPTASGAQDPPDTNVVFTGIPSHNYIVTAKIRGVVVLKSYTTPGWALPGSLVTCSPVPPAATTLQACFNFTGTLNGHGYIYGGDGTIEWALHTPTTIYALNTGKSNAPTMLDYTFSFPLTTDDDGNATFGLTCRTIDSSTAGNSNHFTMNDLTPALMPAVTAILGTNKQWLEFDLMSVANA